MRRLAAALVAVLAVAADRLVVASAGVVTGCGLTAVGVCVEFGVGVALIVAGVLLAACCLLLIDTGEGKS